MSYLLKNNRRGKLRIYIGFAPGVGKTFAMLREAKYLKDNNYDVVIGWLEENSREETLELAKELETIPAQQIEYKGTIIKEMDVQGVVARHPYLAVVDELAHTNISGTLYEKRFQDIEYLRDNGINVITTLNIQHVEGVKHSAAMITGTNVVETVPDLVLDNADEVVLIDVSPQLLLERLEEGKIFSKELVNRNTYNLFSPSKLLALRELALRYTADEVDERLEDIRKRKGLSNNTAVHDKILVCVNLPATAHRLIAMGANISKKVTGELYVCYVQIDSNLSDMEQDFELVETVKHTVQTQLFADLTAKHNGKFLIVKVSDSSLVARGITRLIKEKKITQVIIGESGIPRWKEILRGSIITRILSDVQNIDVLIAGNRENLKSNEHNSYNVFVDPVEKKKGKFKIYLGASAGVGKTVAMLREAQSLRKKGTDIVLGAIETHGRKETEEYIGNLEMVPLKELNYRGLSFKEMDVNAILKRKPQIVLIDELAHNNVPGTKNLKRFEDVEEILQEGIDVISAINIQHIESLNDLIQDITSVHIRETVPDYVITEADELVLIDVTPEILRGRLREGKIYSQDKIERALNSFFRKENLQALREIALREVAQDIEVSKKIDDKANLEAVKEKILVCIKGRVEDDRLIRRGYRISQRFKAELSVLHVKDNHRYTLVESQQVDILKNLTERLGATFLIEEVKTKRQIKDTIIHFLEMEQITKLVVGQSARTRKDEIFYGSIINEVLKKIKGIDIFIIAEPRHRKTN